MVGVEKVAFETGVLESFPMHENISVLFGFGTLVVVAEEVMFCKSRSRGTAVCMCRLVSVPSWSQKK